MKMSNTIKVENKHERTSNYKSWKKRNDLILEMNKVLDLVKGKVKKPTNKSSVLNFLRVTLFFAMIVAFHC